MIIMEKVYLNIERTKYMALTEKRKESMYKYAKENLKRIPLDVQKDKYEEIKAHAEKQNESVNGFIKRAIDEAIEHDNRKLTSTSSIESEGKL